MSVPILFTVGTPGGTWAPWIEKLLLQGPSGSRLATSAFGTWLDTWFSEAGSRSDEQSAALLAGLDALAPSNADPEAWGGVDVRGVWGLHILAGRFPEAHYLIVVEDPVAGMALQLDRGLDVEPRVWLETWRLGAEKLLLHAQRDPGRCMLVDADEARRTPNSLVAACNARFGLGLTIGVLPSEPLVIDPLSGALAASMLGSAGDVAALFAELQASCVLLGDDEVSTVRPGSLRRFDGLEAAQHFNRLRAERDLAHRLKSEANHEREALLAQLLSMRATEHSSLHERQLADQLRVERDVALGALEARSRECELHMLHLEQIQDELTAVQLENERRNPVTPAFAMLGTPDFSIGNMRVGPENDAPPHRHLDIDLIDVRVAEREVAVAKLRLVEHRGHPGLLVFSEPNRVSLLKELQESGRENNRPYALFLPNDAGCRPLFDALDSTDWLVLLSVVQLTEGDLLKRGTPSTARWAQTARRLSEQLQELPPRFRWDTLDVVPLPERGAGVLRLQFGGAHCGTRLLPRLIVEWQAAGSRPEMELIRDTADLHPPLPSWPDDVDGNAPFGLRVPLHSSDIDLSLRRRLSSLAPADVEFLLALAGALPEVVRCSRDLLLSAQFDADGLASASLVVREAALRVLIPAKTSVRSLLRRASQRLHRRGKVAG